MGMIITRTNEDDNAHQEAAEQEKKELIEALVVKTKMEEEEVGIDIIFDQYLENRYKIEQKVGIVFEKKYL